MVPTLAAGLQVQQTETTPNTPIGKAPVTSPVPATSPSTPATRTDSCTPTTSLLRFDGGYEVSMCYVTPDGVTGQAKAGLYASAESGLLWFFSRDNAEVLVKVLNGCAINGYRWIFVAPVTTLEFNLRVTSPTGVRWSHGNTQGVTAATKSDVAAFACADEPQAATDLIVSRVSVSDATPVAGQSVSQNIALRSTAPGVLSRGDGTAAAPNGRAGPAFSASATSLRYHYSSASPPDEAIDVSDAFIASTASDTAAAPTPAVGQHGPQTETTPTGEAPMFAPVTTPVSSSTTPGCTPTTSLLRFDGGYEVSLCYRTPDTPDGTEGNTGQAKAGLYASAESGLLWFFSRDNAEVLVKVLNGCAINGYRWVFVAPVTTLEFDLWVTSPTGARWTHGNTQGVTAATRSDVAAFACADEPEAAPDLTVSSSVSDATPVAGKTITLRATVRNRGNGPAAPTTLRFYRSGDSTISTSDVELGSDAVATLSASATESGTFHFRTPSTAGTFYVGACIDSVPAESRTGNNCSAGVRVVVEDDPDEAPEAAPDLIVSSVSVSDPNPVVEDSFEFHATVLNRGNGSATPTTIGRYKSDDSIITTSDFLLEDQDLPALVRGATESVTFIAQSGTPGPYYLGACIESVAGESDTGNNCSDGVLVTVVPPPAPDLIVSVSVSDENPVAGDVVKIQATVQNQGGAPATPTTIRYYRSEDSTIDGLETELGSDALAALAASATESRTFDFTVPSTADTFYLGACIDSVSDESDTGNNCSDGVLVTVEPPPPAPDLTVSVSVSDENPVAGDVVEIQATVQNQGDAPATPTTILYYRSEDSTIGRLDTEVGSGAVAALAASATASLTFDFTVPSTAGTLYLGACFDAVAAESDTNNNCSDGVLVTVEERPPAPDLIVSSAVSPENPIFTGQRVDFTATARNQGNAPSPGRGATLSFYVSDDSTIDASDEFYASTSMPVLAPSDTWSWSLSQSHTVPVTYYIGACVSGVFGEADTDNNCSDGVLVTVEKRPPAPDLTVPSFSVTDADPDVGQTIEMLATVENRGDAGASATTLRFYRSSDSTIDTEDDFLSSVGVPALFASSSRTVRTRFLVSDSGTFYLGACVDRVSGEIDTDNNCSDGELVEAD